MMNINDDKLSHDIRLLFNEGIKAVMPSNLLHNALQVNGNTFQIKDVKQNISKYELDQYEKIIVIGAGKASVGMAEELEKIFINSDQKVTAGVIVAPYSNNKKLEYIDVIEAGHPLPDKNGVIAAEEIIRICSDAAENDLIINLLSGGASSLLPAPIDEISLKDKIAITSELLLKGASIEELNLVRKHLSKIKGGKLLEYIYPANVVSIIVSDVIDDNINVIGSGITSIQKNDFEGFDKIIKKYDLQKLIPNSLKSETLKNEDQTESNSLKTIANNIIVGNNSLALNRIESQANELGYLPIVMNRKLSGEAGKAAGKIVDDIIKLKKNDEKKRYCLIYGGETWVNVKGNGEGGRNQELVLSVAIKIDGITGVQFLSGGTDGIDGITNAAGAVCSGETISNARNLNINELEYLDNNNSYNFFKKTDQLIITGPTGTNVADIQIALLNT